MLADTQTGEMGRWTLLVHYSRREARDRMRGGNETAAGMRPAGLCLTIPSNGPTKPPLAGYGLTLGRSIRSRRQRSGCGEHDPHMGRFDAHRQRETARPWEAAGSEISEDGLWWRSPTRPTWSRMPYVDQYGNAWDGVT